MTQRTSEKLLTDADIERSMDAECGPRDRTSNGLSPREQWLVIEGFISGYHSRAPLRNERISDIARAWLDDSVADGVTVAMALAHEAAKQDRAADETPAAPDRARELLARSWFKSAKDEPGLHGEVMAYFGYVIPDVASVKHEGT